MTLTEPLVLADDIRLSTFVGWIVSDVQEMTSQLAQTKGLESLHIKCRDQIRSTNRDQQELIHGVISHKDTLRVLNLDLRLDFTSSLDIVLWELHVVQAIQCCKKLVTLSLPLLENRSINYYLELIAAFPDLENLTIHEDCRNEYTKYPKRMKVSN